mmetsp:Transcript_7638/g.14048  ORF Transcript_7638/g.14048 Transcript_7638/m.14048 type:complete len:590 (-) Transcript_7638:127-1896(-)
MAQVAAGLCDGVGTRAATAGRHAMAGNEDVLIFTLVRGSEGASSDERKRFELPRGSTKVIKIGRATKNDLVINSPGVSWNHLEFKLLPAPAKNGEDDMGDGAEGDDQLKLCIRDASSNGTGLQLPGSTLQRLPKGEDTVVPDGALIALPMRLKAAEEQKCYTVHIGDSALDAEEKSEGNDSGDWEKYEDDEPMPVAEGAGSKVPSEGKFADKLTQMAAAAAAAGDLADSTPTPVPGAPSSSSPACQRIRAGVKAGNVKEVKAGLADADASNVQLPDKLVSMVKKWLAENDRDGAQKGSLDDDDMVVLDAEDVDEGKEARGVMAPLPPDDEPPPQAAVDEPRYKVLPSGARLPLPKPAGAAPRETAPLPRSREKDRSRDRERRRRKERANSRENREEAVEPAADDDGDRDSKRARKTLPVSAPPVPASIGNGGNLPTAPLLPPPQPLGAAGMRPPGPPPAGHFARASRPKSSAPPKAMYREQRSEEQPSKENHLPEPLRSKLEMAEKVIDEARAAESRNQWGQALECYNRGLKPILEEILPKLEKENPFRGLLRKQLQDYLERAEQLKDRLDRYKASGCRKAPGPRGMPR